MKPRMTVVAGAFAVLLISAPARAAEERLDIDPALQGLWKLYATSEDKGATIKEEEGSIYARVTGTKVRLGKEIMTVEKVFLVEDDKGNLDNIVRFSNGTVWGITKDPNQPYVLVQVFRDDGKGLKETFRFLVTAQE